MLYADHEPFGPPREDQRAGTVAAVIANVNRDTKRRPEPFGIDDFFPPLREPESPEEAQERRIAQLKAWAIGRNATADGRPQLIRVPK